MLVESGACHCEHTGRYTFDLFGRHRSSRLKREVYKELLYHFRKGSVVGRAQKGLSILNDPNPCSVSVCIPYTYGLDFDTQKKLKKWLFEYVYLIDIS